MSQRLSHLRPFVVTPLHFVELLSLTVVVSLLLYVVSLKFVSFVFIWRLTQVSSSADAGGVESRTLTATSILAVNLQTRILVDFTMFACERQPAITHAATHLVARLEARPNTKCHTHLQTAACRRTRRNWWGPCRWRSSGREQTDTRCTPLHSTSHGSLDGTHKSTLLYLNNINISTGWWKNTEKGPQRCKRFTCQGSFDQFHVSLLKEMWLQNESLFMTNKHLSQQDVVRGFLAPSSVDLKSHSKMLGQRRPVWFI